MPELGPTPPPLHLAIGGTRPRTAKDGLSSYLVGRGRLDRGSGSRLRLYRPCCLRPLTLTAAALALAITTVPIAAATVAAATVAA